MKLIYLQLSMQRYLYSSLKIKSKKSNGLRVELKFSNILRSVQPTACRLRAAQVDYEHGPPQNCKFT